MGNMVEEIIVLCEARRIQLGLNKKEFCELLKIDYTNYGKATRGTYPVTPPTRSRIYLFLLASDNEIK
ncbi:hypothetical protein BAOM_2279 [Peribacillus asahii]|uniref:XRE family transcriptional regulator n=1 Tax=Peribacillus asahii TaxID=228899 RepID=A0A3T0KRK0_9BACI|nr:hypothetical protein [Peribacillus asahii]AZV42888.1 hypothetical protein BAOM_2279 [Peribacillus asahii]